MPLSKSVCYCCRRGDAIKKEIKEEVISLLPSKELQVVLLKTIPQWTVMQTATLAFRYMGMHRFSKFLRKLAKETDVEEERAFLRKASHDVRRHSFDRYGFSNKTDRLYENMCLRMNLNPMRTVFLECCRLPVLVKLGDIVRFREKRKLKYGIVAHVPKYSDKNFDLSDEIICVYDISIKPDYEEWVYNDIFLFPSDIDIVDEIHIPKQYLVNLAMYRKLLQI